LVPQRLAGGQGVPDARQRQRVFQQFDKGRALKIEYPLFVHLRTCIHLAAA
jgi:hypothetical protein